MSLFILGITLAGFVSWPKRFAVVFEQNLEGYIYI